MHLPLKIETIIFTWWMLKTNDMKSSIMNSLGTHMHRIDCPLSTRQHRSAMTVNLIDLKLAHPRAHHELTCKLIWIQPAGILISKIPIRNCTDKFPWVTCLNKSGTCRTTDHLLITGTTCRYPQVFALATFCLQQYEKSNDSRKKKE